MILFECKFTEQDGGTCLRKRYGAMAPSHANGNWRQQTLPGIDITSRCPLSEKGIQYWDIIPKVFHLDAQTDYRPCLRGTRPTNGCAISWWPIRWRGRKTSNRRWSSSMQTVPTCPWPKRSGHRNGKHSPGRGRDRTKCHCTCVPIRKYSRSRNEQPETAAVLRKPYG